MTPTIPSEITPLLDAFRHAIEAQFPDLVSGLYLHGSIALGAFQTDWSDIDFVATLTRPCSAIELQVFAQIHEKIVHDYPQWKLQGDYLIADEQGYQIHFSYDESLKLSSQPLDDMTKWLIQYQNITLFGEPLHWDVDWETINRQMRANMNTYWRRFTFDPTRIIWLLSDYGIQWVVLGILRQYYSFHEHDITSKIGAGEYGLRQLPHQQRIIQEALNIRHKKTGSLYSSPIIRAYEAWHFLRTIITLCQPISPPKQ